MIMHLDAEQVMAPAIGALKSRGFNLQMTRKIIAALATRSDAERYITYSVPAALAFAEQYRRSLCMRLGKKVESGDMTLEAAAAYVGIPRIEFLKIIFQAKIDAGEELFTPDEENEE